MPVLSQTPVITYTANGSVTSFAYPFQILSADDLKVYVGGTIVTTGYSVTGAGNVGGGNVIFLAAPANGLAVRLARSTTINRITDYVEGGAVPAATLDADFDRTIMMLQEYSALALREDTSGVIDAVNRKIVNLGTATNPNDATSKSYVDTLLASQVIAAAGSASAASSSATTAGNWATAANISAASASTYANNASTSAGNALTSANNAAASAASAAGYVVPTQTSNSGKFLTTDGSVTSWGAIPTLNQNTSGYAMVLGGRQDFGLEASSPTSYPWGQVVDFIYTLANWPSLTYGTVITTKGYSAGGGTLQMYTPYSPSYGGKSIKVRFGNFDVNGGNSWTAWRSLIDDSMCLGIGQTWQDVTGSRAFGTTYTNSTGKPIQVIVSMGVTVVGGVHNITVGGVQITNPASGGYSDTNSFIVPDGATYVIAALNCTLSKWSELR